MTITPRHAWPLARLIAGQDVNGEAEDLPPNFRRIFNHLAELDPEARGGRWEIIQATHPEGDALALAIAGINPGDDCPEAEAGSRRPATIEDIRKIMAGTRWEWEGFIPSSRLFGVAGFEGTGKTRLALDLAARMYHKRPWPDGQAPTLPEGTRTLWICSDGQHDELAETAAAFDLPDKAVAFCAIGDEPYEGTSIDDLDTLALLNEFMGAERFGMVCIDSLTNATARNLCSQQDTKVLGSPLRDLAQRHQTPIGLLLHLARDGGVLGRRIRGLARVIIQLDAPDPDRPDRLKLWVPKSFAKKPSPLGVTIGEKGNAYDHEPPEAPEPGKGGRPSKARDDAVEFIRSTLTKSNDRLARDLCTEWEKSGKDKNAFWRARDYLVEQDDLVSDGKPLMLHLVREESKHDA